MSLTINKTKSLLPPIEVIVHVLFWCFYFASINVDWNQNWFDRDLRVLTPTPLTTFLFPIAFYLNALYLIPKLLKGKKWYLYFIVASMVIGLAEFIRCIITAYLHPVTESISESVVVEFLSKDNLIFGFPLSMILAFILSFAYRFTKDWIVNGREIERLKNEKLTMELNLLKSQVDPHFLFNNLNTLDDLIDVDPKEAKAYVQRLSKLYRFSITNLQKDVVPLSQELQYVKDYIYLISKRFGDVYQFEIDETAVDVEHYLIPPSTLQSLVENAVKHNVGSPSNPLQVTVRLSANKIEVSNAIRLKNQKVDSLGTGLRNLRTRYKLISDMDITVSEDDAFTVHLPMIKKIL